MRQIEKPYHPETPYLGNFFKEARKVKGWTATQLAKKVGVSQSFITGIETGSHYPSDRVLALVADELGVDPRFLMLLAGKLHPQFQDAAVFNPKEVYEFLAKLTKEKAGSHAKR